MITAIAKQVLRAGCLPALVSGEALAKVDKRNIGGFFELVATYNGKVPALSAEDETGNELSRSWLAEQAQESGVLWDSETADGDFDIDVSFAEAGGFDIPMFASFDSEVTIDRKGNTASVERVVALQAVKRLADGYRLTYHVS